MYGGKVYLSPGHTRAQVCPILLMTLTAPPTDILLRKQENNSSQGEDRHRCDATSLAHLYLGSFSNSSPRILSSSVRLDGECCCTAIFQVSPEMFDWVQGRALAGPLKDIQRLVPKPLLRCLGCVLRVIVLLEGEALPQSEVLSTLEKVFIKDLSVFCSVHLCLDLD